MRYDDFSRIFNHIIIGSYDYIHARKGGPLYAGRRPRGLRRTHCMKNFKREWNHITWNSKSELRKQLIATLVVACAVICVTVLADVGVTTLLNTIITR